MKLKKNRKVWKSYRGLISKNYWKNEIKRRKKKEKIHGVSLQVSFWWVLWS